MRAHTFALSMALLALPALLAIGCDSADFEPETAEERAELPPQHLPLEGSPTAYGMLRVVNELPLATLDREVALDRRAAQSIVGFRAGPDGLLDTADDRYVDSIAQLDELHWLGEANLWTIQHHALLEGFVPESLPIARCPAVLAEVVDQCLRFTEQAATGEATMDDLVPSCLEQSEPSCPSSEFFAQQGMVDYEDPMLGYHALLCDSEAPAEPCALGVAGMAAHFGPHCDALYDAG
ncbi:MAG: hypothetical protein AAGF11_00970 [Myxococcota bacterium]